MISNNVKETQNNYQISLVQHYFSFLLHFKCHTCFIQLINFYPLLIYLYKGINSSTQFVFPISNTHYAILSLQGNTTESSNKGSIGKSFALATYPGAYPTTQIQPSYPGATHVPATKRPQQVSSDYFQSWTNLKLSLLVLNMSNEVMMCEFFV